MKTTRTHSKPSPARRGLRLALLLGALLAAGATAHEASAAGLLHVKDVTVTAPAGGAAEVLVVTTGSPQFTARVTDTGRRLIIDLEGADVAGAPGAITKGNAIVGGVMTQAFQQSGQPITRVVVNLAHQAEYRITPEPGALRVSLVAAEKTAPMGNKPALRPAPAAAVGNVRFDHQGGVDSPTASSASWTPGPSAGRCAPSPPTAGRARRIGW
jgi:type IV pilus assembly protein PilQ